MDLVHIFYPEAKNLIQKYPNQLQDINTEIEQSNPSDITLACHESTPYVIYGPDNRSICINCEKEEYFNLEKR